MRVKFIFSSKYFSGFTMSFHVNEIESIELIIQIMVDKLTSDLKNLNLEVLVEELKKLKFHYHGYNLLNVLTEQREEWYICECCQDTNTN